MTVSSTARSETAKTVKFPGQSYAYNNDVTLVRSTSLLPSLSSRIVCGRPLAVRWLLALFVSGLGVLFSAFPSARKTNTERPVARRLSVRPLRSGQAAVHGLGEGPRQETAAASGAVVYSRS